LSDLIIISVNWWWLKSSWMSWVDSSQSCDILKSIIQLGRISKLLVYLFLLIQVVLRSWFLIIVVVVHDVVLLIPVLIDKRVSHLRSAIILLVHRWCNYSILVYDSVGVHSWVRGGILLNQGSVIDFLNKLVSFLGLSMYLLLKRVVSL
jgi:hypothetical protein